MGNSAVPNFLCIGALKSATSWLDHNLRQHPEIWMPPVKEVTYFNLQRRIPFVFYVGRRSQGGVRLAEGLKRLHTHPLWVMRYLLGYRTDSWYQSLFRAAPGQICGEATPSYSPLVPEKVAHIKSLLPNAKIIYLLREPIDRVWSQLKMWSSKNQRTPVDNLTDEELHQTLMARFASYSRHCDYLGNLARWESHYRPEQMHIGFYDQIAAEPASFLKGVWRYLDVTVDDKLVPPDVAMPRNQRSARRRLPVITERWLAEQLYPQYEALDQRFDNVYTARWLQKAKMVLQKNG